MGVAGAGKTTIGAELARTLGWRFVEGDDFHPAENVAKMAAGHALDDADRKPWLETLNRELRALEGHGESAVLACSALKRSYRERLGAGLERVEWVYLQGDIDLIRSRLAERSHRYMPATLLQSQFDALEPPQHAIVVDVRADVAACVATIAARLRSY
jgi:gluconokinase